MQEIGQLFGDGDYRAGMSEVVPGYPSYHLLDYLSQSRSGIIDRCRLLQMVQIIEDHRSSGEVGGKGGEDIGGEDDINFHPPD